MVKKSYYRPFRADICPKTHTCTTAEANPVHPVSADYRSVRCETAVRHSIREA